MTQRKTNILLVEDDELDVLNLQRAFERSNLPGPVMVAHDGVEALEILRSDAAPRDRCLVLLDLNMPRMGGLEFLQELRADPALRSLPVVVLTTSTDECDRTAAYDLNVAGYLVKPMRFPTFVEMVSTLDQYWSYVELP